jgi:hypothetical protein
MPQPTIPEPWCDIRAQFFALNDPSHPKDTMWISWGTPRPDFEAIPYLCVVECDGGTLATNNRAKAEYFSLMPSEDALADVLGYPAPKSRLDPLRVAVVQAVDRRGNVITEVCVDLDEAERAAKLFKPHGDVLVTSMESAVMRRLFLIRQEAEG